MKYVGVFVDQSGRTLTISEVDDASEPYRIRVTLPAEIDAALHQHPDYPFEIADELRGWVYVDSEAGEALRVEAGVLRMNGLGPTLNLRFVSHDELKPNLGLGLYDDWEDDLGLPWVRPLSVYRRQSAAE